MSDAKGFLKRIALVALISALPGYVDLVSAHGGGHGTGGSGGAGGGSSSSSSGGGHSSGGMGGGHSSTGTSGGHSSSGTSAGHFSTSPKGGRSADPSNVTQSGANHHIMPVMNSRSNEGHKVFVPRFNRTVSSGETGQNIQGGMVPNEDWKRRHRRLFGFIPY
jgi:hypothetical protein